MDKIKFAVIGLGHIGKRHAEMIRKNLSADLVAVCDIKSPEECKFQIEKSRYYISLEGLLQNEKEVDVVNICTPNGLHAQMAIECLNANKHVVVEKPMALSTKDAKEIIGQSVENGKHVFCVMQNRYSPPSVWAKELMDKNLLGEIFQVQINCLWNRDIRYYTDDSWHGDNKLDGGTLFTQFSHFIDMMFWLFGDITNIEGQFADFNHHSLTNFEDSGIVHFDFVNGGMGSLSYSTAVFDKNLESSMTVIGEKGSIKIAGQYMNEVVYQHIDNYEMPTLPQSAPPNDYGDYKGSAQNHHHVIQNVIDTLSGNGIVGTNMMDGLKVVEIIERVYAIRDQKWNKKTPKFVK